MCVIIVKPAGQAKPSRRILELAYRANPHGCGFASTNHKYKGLSFEKFLKEFDKVSADEACIIHFRYATHGSIKRSNCHPFRDHDIFFAHNGILDIKPIGDTTDSETAFRTEIMPAIKRYGFHSNETKKVIEKIIGYSKFALLQGKSLKLFGHYEEVGGLYYSNLRFMPFKSKLLNSYYCAM